MRRYASELTSALNALDASDGVHARRALAPGGEFEAPSDGGRRRRPVPGVLRRLRNDARRFRRARRAARLDGDVFHVIDQRDAPLLSALPRGRSVQTVHDLLGISEAPDSGSAQRMRERLIEAAQLVAISRTTRDEIVELLEIPAEQVAVIPNGIDAHFRTLPPARLGALYDLLPAAEFRVLHVSSNAQPRKNLATTIRVLHTLRRQGLDATLIHAGVPLPEAERELASELGVAEQVADRGYVSEDRLVELYNAADVLLFPSRYEGFGWPPLEAMACGLPVVASDIAALRETIGAEFGPGGESAALLAAPDDVEALASHVAAVLTDRDLSGRLRGVGFERAREFSWERTARAYAEIYRQLLAG